MHLKNYADTMTLIGFATPGTFDEIDNKTLEKLIAHASRMMRRITRAAIYDTDKAGNPLDDSVIEAFREATCLQVEMWVTAGIHAQILDNGATLQPRLASSTNNGSSVAFDYAASDAARAYLLGGGLSLAAELALRDAGLIGQLPGVWT